VKILYTGTVSVFDTSTHAGNVKALLEGLASLGHSISTLTGPVFSHVAPSEVSSALSRLGFSASPRDPQLFEMQDGAVQNRIQLDQAGTGAARNEADLARLAEKIRAAFQEVDPDVILYSNDSPLTFSLFSAFDDFAGRMVLCEDSSQKIEKVQQINIRKIAFGRKLKGDSADGSDTLRLPHQLPGEARNSGGIGSRITFVGPTVENGMVPFVQLYQSVLSALPHERFLIVQRPGELERLEAASDLKLEDFRKLDVLVHPWFDYDYLDTSSALLLFSSEGHAQIRLALEAMARGVPVLATDTPEFSDILGEAQNLFSSPLPKAGSARMPPSSAILPWAMALAELATDPEFREEQATAMRQAADEHLVSGHLDQIDSWLRSKFPGSGAL
jgi:glycosyltransferase involved in cell wall biosynthesis